MDFGFRRIGIAVGESEPRITGGRPPLAASGSLSRDASAIARLAKAEGAERIVVGVPKHPQGARRMERVCLELAKALESLGWQVATVNEALSSREAERTLRGLSPTKRKARQDAEAAKVILERYFDGLA